MKRVIVLMALLVCVGLTACEREQKATDTGQVKVTEAGKGSDAAQPAAVAKGEAEKQAEAGKADTAPGADSGQKGNEAVAGDKPEDWDAAALQTAEQLANKVRAAGIVCDDYGPSVFGLFDEQYQSRLPLAAAVTSCTTDDDEDLTFEVFPDAKQAHNYIETKQAYLCKRAKQAKLDDFPGFPYIEGGAWVLEPDEKETADKLAQILGGKSYMASCQALWMLQKQESESPG